MGATAVAAVESNSCFEELEQGRRAQARLADEIKRTDERLAAIESQRKSLLPSIAEGDKSASARVDELDAEKLRFQRAAEGLQIKRAELEATVRAADARCIAVSQERAAEEHRKRVESYRERLARGTHNLMARWRGLCRENCDLADLRWQVESDRSLTELERSSLFTLVAEPLSSLGGIGWNEGWVKTRGVPLLTFPNLGMRPPDDKKDLEELK